jgi:hypothetical protein
MSEIKLSADVKIVPKAGAKRALRPITVGFLIRYKTTRKYVRRRFLDQVEAQRKPDQEQKLYTKLPCGEEYVFTYDEFPVETMPCRCGNPDHFVVRYDRYDPRLPAPVSTDKNTLFVPEGRKEGEESKAPVREGDLSEK